MDIEVECLDDEVAILGFSFFIRFAHIIYLLYFCGRFAALAELVDAPDLGSGSLRSEGSSPLCRTLGKRRGGSMSPWAKRSTSLTS